MSTPSVLANAVFLPWVRQGAVSLIASTDSLGAQSGSASLLTTLTVNNSSTAAGVVARLHGPGDVIGLSQREIVRREPPPNTAAFEANHFAAIEFDRPDFPWLFTPAKAGGNARLRPWLCLIVVRKQPGVTVLPPINAPLPSLTITTPAVPADELPDLSESWLWAHSQVAAPENADTAALKTTLAGDPQLSLSRLICPRLLAPDTDYIACLVPTFSMGRKAGLGLPVEAEQLLPAWSFPASGATVTLPLYDHWNFRTGLDGDFKTLVKRLKPQVAPTTLGKRAMRIDRPGFSLPATFPAAAQLNLEGALQPIQSTAGTWPSGTEVPFQTELAKIVNATNTSATADPLLTPPLYGRWHANKQTALRTDQTWFEQLNLDPRHRAVAAFGTRVIQEHQEALMASAWEQAGDLQAANQRMRQLQLSVSVAESLNTRHFERMPTDTLLRVMAPALGRTRAPAVPGKIATMASAFVGTSFSLQAVVPAVRKLTRTRGPVNRRVLRVANISNALGSFVSTLNVPMTTHYVIATPPTMLTFDAYKLRANQTWFKNLIQITGDYVASIIDSPQYQIEPEGTRIRWPVLNAEVPLVDNPIAVAFRAAAVKHLRKLNPNRVSTEQPRLFTAVDLSATGGIRLQMKQQMQARPAGVALAKVVVPIPIQSGNQPAPTTPTPSDSTRPIDTVMLAPKFTQPMYEPLRDLSQDLLLPGLSDVAPDTVIGLRTNSRFVNAYMVGLNAEMGRELLWRGFPTDQRGTYFNQFWDTASASAPHVDIDPMHQWGNRPLAGDANGADGRFVMLMRSELLRRYPTASIFAVPAIMSNGKRVPTTDQTLEVHPSFRGSLPPDITFIGFDLTTQKMIGGGSNGNGYFIVIQEQPTEPRFGIDDNLRPTGRTHLPTASGAPTGMNLRGLTWRQNAAHMAGILKRQPVRIAIHAAQFVLSDNSY